MYAGFIVGACTAQNFTTAVSPQMRREAMLMMQVEVELSQMPLASAHQHD